MPVIPRATISDSAEMVAVGFAPTAVGTIAPSATYRFLYPNTCPKVAGSALITPPEESFARVQQPSACTVTLLRIGQSHVGSGAKIAACTVRENCLPASRMA